MKRSWPVYFDPWKSTLSAGAPATVVRVMAPRVPGTVTRPLRRTGSQPASAVGSTTGGGGAGVAITVAAASAAATDALLSAPTRRVWHFGQTDSPFAYHVQQVRQTARLIRDPDRSNATELRIPSVRASSGKETARQNAGGPL